MQILSIDPIIPFVLPPGETVSILIIGCGGTGSHVAQAAARLAVHCRAQGTIVHLGLLDGDIVEAKNVGRQLFSAADIGTPKATALAARFGSVFGLPVTAGARMLTGERIQAVGLGIVVGCVDNTAGRQAIRSLLGDAGGWRLWIDCGNHEASGQVSAGNATQLDKLKGCLALGTVTSAIPAAPIVDPELFADPRRAAQPSALDCAEAMIDNAQSLMVNQMMAAIAAEYLYNAVVHRRLTTFRTVVDLATLTMRSQTITARNLAAATGLTEAQLRGTRKKGRKKAA